MLFFVVKKKKMSLERNVFIGLLAVVCLLQFDVIADVIVAPCPTKCKCVSSGVPLTVLGISCFNQTGIDPQQLHEQIDSIFVSSVNSSLVILQIAFTPLSQVPRSLCRLTALVGLTIRNNRLVELPNNCSMGQLQYLDLRDNNIANISKAVFDAMGQLTYLDLSDNKIANLPGGYFDGIGKLYTLILSGNNITKLSNELFDGIGQLWKLNLSNNQIENIANGAFGGMRQLNILDLSGNKITDLSDGVFDDMGQLTHLNLSDNNIANLPNGVFDNMGQLLELNLGNNQIAELPNCIFDNMSHLTHLYLRDNQIADIAKGVFNGTGKLYSLDLSNNKITKLSNGVFDGIGQLNKLDLNNNQIDDLANKVFDGMRQLTILNLSGNKIFDLSNGAFDGMNQLKSLNLRSNQIANLPNGVFDGMSRLNYLDLRSNQIANLPNGVFDGMYQLGSLILTGNQIASIGRYTFSSKPNMSIQIHHLYLDDNQLTSLQPWWHNVIITAKLLSIGKNPWDCSCDNKQMTGWLISIVGQINDINDVLCYIPHRLHGKTIIQMSDEEFCMDPEAEATKRAWAISLSSVAGVVIVLLSVGVIVYRLRVKLYTRFKFHPFDRDECRGEDMDYDVFFCCSSQDDEPEGRRIIKTVEDRGYKVCYHYRNFTTGLITANIEASVTSSKRTLCLLTWNFVHRFANVFMYH